MCLRNKRFLPALIIFFCALMTQSQTLYWVGGSGNFNDPNHWSLFSGGAPSNVIPSALNDLVFDNNIGNTALTVNFSGTSSVKSIKIQTYKNINFNSNSGTAKIKISGRFEDILDNTGFQSTVSFEFNNNGTHEGYISTGQTPLNCNLEVNGGKWRFNKAIISYTNSLDVKNSQVSFLNSPIKAGALSIENCNSLVLDFAMFQVPGAVSIKNCLNYSANKSYLNKKPFASFFQPIIITPTQQGKFSSNQINLPCATFTVTKPSCMPGCDGRIVLSLPNFSCYTTAIPTPTAYNVDVIGSGCGTVTSLVLVGPGTYTISGICSCVSDYALQIFEIH
jgi:hypothetical protein